MDNKKITIKPLNGNDLSPLVVGLAGDAIYLPASGSGGWQIVDRPKRTAATQWVDRAPWSLSFEGIVTHQNAKPGFTTNGNNVIQTIENECTRIESWTSSVPGTLEPPVFTINGPVPGIHHAWCLYTLEFNQALRDGQSGMRYQQNVKFTFYEYVPPFANETSIFSGQISPTDTYYYGTESIVQAPASFQYYTASEGDTVSSIAVKYNLGVLKVSKLLQINNIRDPRSIQAGQTILIPN